MAETNNSWVKYLVGVLVSILIAVVMMLGNNVIANDKDSRDRDKEIVESVACKVDSICEKQDKTNREILIALAELKADIKYVKQAVKM